MLCVTAVPAAAARLGRFLPDWGRLREQRGPYFLKPDINGDGTDCRRDLAVSRVLQRARGRHW